MKFFDIKFDIKVYNEDGKPADKKVTDFVTNVFKDGFKEGVIWGCVGTSIGVLTAAGVTIARRLKKIKKEKSKEN